MHFLHGLQMNKFTYRQNKPFMKSVCAEREEQDSL